MEKKLFFKDAGSEKAPKESGSEKKQAKNGVEKKATKDSKNSPYMSLRSIILIQQWYRRFAARLEMRRRCTWRIFQSIEYSGEQDHLKLNGFFDYLLENFTASNSKERELLNRLLTEPEPTKESKMGKMCESITVPDNYMGPRLSFPLTRDDATALLDAFKNDQQLHVFYVLKLFQETQLYLSQLPNITNISTCYSEEITVCGDLHGQLSDLLQIFYKKAFDKAIGLCLSFLFTFHVQSSKKDVLLSAWCLAPKNGLPSPQKLYVFNGDFVDRGKHSMEILIILFVFLLIYPKEIHLNRGNHEDYMINLRYGLTKEVSRKYKEHANKILKMLQNIFSYLPLATVIDQKVLVVHGGVSDRTSLEQLAKVERWKIISVLTQKRRRTLEAIEFSRSISNSRVESSQLCRRSSGIRKLSSTSCVLEADVSSELPAFEDEDIKQVLDILWSDPDYKNGCRLNVERGGGCYFGPDVTETFLQKHGLQFIIRSHECKPEGYEFCHNRKVITVFSASNYYALGSNRGAYLKLGPDLVPHFIQFQASKGVSRQLTMTQRISRVEESAYQILREKLFAHRSDLIVAFRKFDKKNTGFITLNDWAKAVESVLHLGLPWRMLRPQLVLQLTNGKLDYKMWLKDIVTEEKSSIQERLQSSLLENIYRNLSNLETIFSIIDTDHSGQISLEEFHQIWKLFSTHMNIAISDDKIDELARSIDFNKDGYIDFNEFIEAFRLVRTSSA